MRISGCDGSRGGSSNGGRAFRVNFDLHRASGLWLWAMLFIFAWSSVMMDIRPVYDWVTQRLFDYQSPDEEYMMPSPRAGGPPHLDWRAAHAAGERTLQEQA
ncbi:PepSY domain-containing protein [Methylocapsa sp. D3K7]|uniref:PepSY domain-containing protein n=1 Tax=Methylocapsa sp. D3K7 TaxID=3041435 RepID=UPI003298739D